MAENRAGSAGAVQDVSPREAFEALYESFQTATRAAGGAMERDYTLAGARIRLRLAGPALQDPVTRALAHRGTAPGPAALTVCVWDNASTGTSLPLPGLERLVHGQTGSSAGGDDARIVSHYQASIPALSVLDTKRNLALHCIRDAAQVPYFEAAAPLRWIVTRWMAQRGCALIHAGAVGRPDGGVLLVGKGGSGKSTTTLACLTSELIHAGDDYVLLDGGSRPFVHSLYHSAKVVPEALWRLPHLEPWISNHDRLDREKAVLYLKDGFGEKLSAGFPLRAILLPRITGERATRLVPASPEQSLEALVPSTFIQLPGLGRAGLQLMVQTVQTFPGYVLELGTDLDRIPAVIASLL